jgi:glycosyltransferase involved in cell wall biosynthesis
MVKTTRPVSRFVLITPVRDECEYIGEMIESIMAQQIPPAKWIIVDDGSRDGTQEIVEKYAVRYGCIELVRLAVREQRLPGGEGAIAEALRRIELSEYDFLARFDADLLFEPNYTARILEEFQRDPKLGIAGGALYVKRDDALHIESAPEYHVRGAVKMYRRGCFEQIGGLSTEIGWDTIDEVSAWKTGWRTKTFPDCRVIHRRPTGKGMKSIRIAWERGRAEYLTWSHPVFVATKFLKLVCDTRGLIGPIAFLSGFVCCYARRIGRIQDRDFVATRRRQQIDRIAGLLIGRPQTRVPLPARIHLHS